MKVHLYDVYRGSLVDAPVEFPEIPGQGDEVRLADGSVLQVERRVWAVSGDQVRTLELYLGASMNHLSYDGP